MAKVETARIVLYEYWRSSTSYRARIALNLKGLAYQSVAVDLAAKAHQLPAHLARDPLGRVPVLEIDGLRLVQSIAILEYLEEAYPTPALLPRDAAGRARVRALAMLIAADIHPIGNPSTMAQVDAVLSAAGAAAMDKAAWQRHFIAQGFAAFEMMLADGPGDAAGRFCHGDLPTMADVCLLPQVYNARRWGLELGVYPRILAVEAAAGEVAAFRAAHPDVQSDAARG